MSDNAASRPLSDTENSGGEMPEQDPGTEPQPVPDTDPVEQEESEMEDPAALDALIAEKLGGPEPSSGESFDTASRARSTARPSLVPTAEEIMLMSSAQCLGQLKKHAVPYEKPGFETPLVKTPILLTGPIGGVRIAPMHPQKKPIHSVMDCRLALALVETAAECAAHGITDIEFYSTYRPLTAPPKTCPKGRAGKKCRTAQERYRKTVAEQKSQHRFARAIDIRRFKTATGETLDVLEDFDRRSGRPPCDYVPEASKARTLTALVCALHEHRVFSVMLTPNANKAHHNHFHFDLTPKARWYIVR